MSPIKKMFFSILNLSLFFSLTELYEVARRKKNEIKTVSDWTGTRLVIGYRMIWNRLQRVVKPRKFAHNPTVTKVSSNTSKNLDAKLELKNGKIWKCGGHWQK